MRTESVARITLKLPSMLTVFTGGRDVLPLDAATLTEAISVIRRNHPALAQQIVDEGGRLRQHVLCFHNDRNTRWLEDVAAPLKDGDVLTILQAVSGG